MRAALPIPREKCPRQTYTGRAAAQSCERTQQGPSTPPRLAPHPRAPLAPHPSTSALCHLCPLSSIYLSRWMPAGPSPACPVAHTAPLSSAQPQGPPVPLFLYLGTHTGKTVARAPSLFIACSISYNPDAAVWGAGWTCVSPRTSTLVGLLFPVCLWGSLCSPY